MYPLSLVMLLLSVVAYFLVNRPIKKYAKGVGNKEIHLNQDIAAQVSEDHSAMKNIRILNIGLLLRDKLSHSLN